MISNLYTPPSDLILPYPLSDSGKAFHEYIAECRALIEKRRQDLHDAQRAETIITANSPYEFFPVDSPSTGKRLPYGALLIHGLLDGPFTLRDVGVHLQQQGIYNRAILLPGHGTHPGDLMHVTYQDWMRAVQAGVASLSQTVEKIYLIGYSTGAALSILHAEKHNDIAGIVLLSPAIRIRAPVNLLMKWRKLIRWMNKNKPWLCHENEIDYTKYLSVAINAVTQVAMLTNMIDEMRTQLSCPLFMSLSREDETISSRHAINFFDRMRHQHSQMLLYSASARPFSDKRIELRTTHSFKPQIQHFSHVSIPIAPNNPHYGQDGDYVNATNCHAEDIIYGAYNRLMIDALQFLHKLGAIREKRKELTYNPDFHYLAQRISEFIG